MHMPSAAAAEKGDVRVAMKRQLRARIDTLRDFVVEELKRWRLGAAFESAASRARDGLADQAPYSFKEHLYRPLQVLVSVSALEAEDASLDVSMDTLHSTNMRLRLLRESGHWSPELADQVRRALAAVTGARVLAHTQAQAEQNVACFSFDNCSTCDAEGLYKLLEELQAPILFAGQVVVCLAEVYNSGNFPPSSC
ncbi:unnamed protein product [Polarella glacialis]|uniref:Uncharacterized protein n=1 Tax=Polarella glacialis TaxID=89957 RepID=A0A813HWS5_POLGL|nr:unnamed protein product [Polarella glacialis]CAE8704837.1 unnamed protein product [Polarella glacialis]